MHPPHNTPTLIRSLRGKLLLICMPSPLSQGCPWMGGLIMCCAMRITSTPQHAQTHVRMYTQTSHPLPLACFRAVPWCGPRMGGLITYCAARVQFVSRSRSSCKLSPEATGSPITRWPSRRASATCRGQESPAARPSEQARVRGWQPQGRAEDGSGCGWTGVWGCAGYHVQTWVGQK